MLSRIEVHMACEVSPLALRTSSDRPSSPPPWTTRRASAPVAAVPDPMRESHPVVAESYGDEAAAGRPAHSLLTAAAGATPAGDLTRSHLSLDRLVFVYTLQHASWPLPGSAERTPSGCAKAAAGSGSARESTRRTA